MRRVQFLGLAALACMILAFWLDWRALLAFFEWDTSKWLVQKAKQYELRAKAAPFFKKHFGLE